MNYDTSLAGGSHFKALPQVLLTWSVKPDMRAALPLWPTAGPWRDEHFHWASRTNWARRPLSWLARSLGVGAGFK